MPDAYRCADPEIPCERHPQIAASSSCTRCGALTCDECRRHVGGTQLCGGCKPTSRFAPGALLSTCLGVMAVTAVFAAVTNRPLARTTSPSSIDEVPSIASVAGHDDFPTDFPRCAGEHCFYPLRVLF